MPRDAGVPLVVTPKRFEGDLSAGYVVLATAAHAVSRDEVPGAVLEIGTRAGGSMEVLMTYLPEPPRVFLSVDPFGSIAYQATDRVCMPATGYTAAMRRKTMAGLYAYVMENERHFYDFAMEDWEFFARFADYVPVYHGGQKHEITEYALAFIDGPHSFADVDRARAWLLPRMATGGHLVFDNCADYDHDAIEVALLAEGCVKLEISSDSVRAYRVYD